MARASRLPPRVSRQWNSAHRARAARRRSRRGTAGLPPLFRGALSDSPGRLDHPLTVSLPRRPSKHADESVLQVAAAGTEAIFGRSTPCSSSSIVREPWILGRQRGESSRLLIAPELWPPRSRLDEHDGAAVSRSVRWRRHAPAFPLDLGVAFYRP